jgi:hypothetical protein
VALGSGSGAPVNVLSADFGRCGAAAAFDASGRPVEGGTVVICRGGTTRTLRFDGASGVMTAP